MRIYFDTCALNRPFDDRDQQRIAVECEAMLILLQLIEQGSLEFVSSEAVVREVERTPDESRRVDLFELLRLAHSNLLMTVDVTRRAAELSAMGFKTFDALHVAMAEGGGVDVFCTTDDRLAKRCRALSGLRLRVMTPIELIKELEQ